MRNIGRVFKSQFVGDYWTIVAATETEFLVEATYFSGRPKKCHELHPQCPFKSCNYKRNQFCLSKTFLKMHDEIQGGKLELAIRSLKEEVVYSNWSQHVAGESPPTNRKGYVE